ncbi:MAG: hypothetical protein JWO05_2017 [Gemmatimonadetes bacterium]|nr:hypothetical protein [Gemmatimonadota bacterium]
MSARRLLIVAPAFPPHPSPATHRARFLARYAGANGWDAEVMMVDPRYIAEAPDEELLELLPAGLRITRTKAIPTRLARRVGLGDLGMRAYFPMRRALLQLCRERKPDVLFLPGGPFVTFQLGADVRRELGIPYVLDFTDPWVYPLSEAEDHPWRKIFWTMRLGAAMEPAIVREAAHVLAVSDGTNDGIRGRYPDVPADRFSAVPFGFEATDFDRIRERGSRHEYFDANDGLTHLVYVGAMLPNGYETLRATLRAVQQLRERAPDPFSRLRLHFFGTTYDPNPTRGLVEPVAQEMGLGDIVSEHPRRIPYLDALRVLTSAQGILALGSTDHHYTASKIFPCILARRPLLAVYHERSTVGDVMRETHAGALVTYGDEVRAEQRVGAIADALAALLLPGGYDPALVRLDALESYSAERMSRHIFSVFDRVSQAAHG